MAVDITLLNLSPNIEWWVKIGPNDGQGLIEFFTTQADAEADTNRIAYGEFTFGSDIETMLFQDSDANIDISLFNPQITYYCRATCQIEDPSIIFSVGPYTDKSEITDPLLVDSQPLMDRAQLEMDRGTHIVISREVQLSSHIQGIEIGDTYRLQDGVRGLDQSVRVDAIKIHGDKNSLVTTVRMVEFMSVKR